MREMMAKKVHRKCAMRGCRNTDCFAFTRSIDPGGSVILCPDCAKAITDAAQKYVPPKPKEKMPPAPIGYGLYGERGEATQKPTAEGVSDEGKRKTVKKKGEKEHE